MVVVIVVTALALVLVTIAWGSIMDLGAGGVRNPRGTRPRSHRHAA